MRIESILIEGKEGAFFCNFDSLNQIWSQKNKQGKTTLVRFLIYGLGYNIPISRDINPAHYKTKICLKIRDTSIMLIRTKAMVDVKTNDDSHTFSVSNDNNALMGYIFGIKTYDLFSNLLGSFYIDQANGWNVFNRGKIAPKNHFDVDQLLYSLLGIDLSLFDSKKTLEKQIKEHKNIIDLYLSQNNLDDYSNQAEPIEDNIRDLQQRLSILEYELKSHKVRKKAYIDIKTRNQQFWDHIDSMKLAIIVDGKRIQLTRSNVDGLSQDEDYCEARIIDEEMKIRELEDLIKPLKQQLRSLMDYDQMILNVKAAGAKPSFKIDLEQTKSNLELMKQQVSVLNERIKQSTSDSSYKDLLNEKLLEYAEQLGVRDLVAENDPITSRNFEDVSGTQKQKLLLAYRCSFLKVVSEYLDVNLPIIIDSLNKETDESNLKLMSSFLIDNFSDNQIIIASISRIDELTNAIKLEKPLLRPKDLFENIKKFSV